MKRAAMIFAIASCSGTSSRQHVSFAHLNFDVPGEWTNKDSLRHGLATSIWTPEDNDRKESVTIVRTERAPAVAQAGPPTLASLIANAHAGSPGAKTSGVAPLSTHNGFSGVRIDDDYTPPGMRERYHRVHVVLIDGASLIHVLYTARTPDDNLSALDLVLSTIREGEG